MAVATMTAEAYEDLGLSSDSDVEEDLRSPEGQADSGDLVPAEDLQNNEDFLEYAKSMGVDVNVDIELVPVVRDAFVASLPLSWTEHTDAEGRIYFFHQATQASSWSHPMDTVFRELIQLIKSLRSQGAKQSEDSLSQAIQAHLEQVHEGAIGQLEGWSGPYTSEEGQYYYHAGSEVSSWHNPVDEWRGELALRQQVLYRVLLPGQLPQTEALGDAHVGVKEDDGGSVPLPPLPLNVGLPRDDAPPSPCSARSFRTCISARSQVSVRSRRGGGENIRAPSPRASLAATFAARAAAAEGGAIASSSSFAGLDTSPRALRPGGSRGASPSRLPSLPETSAASNTAVATPAKSTSAKAKASADEGDDELDFTFGHGAAINLPKFGT
eukprot:TRINITY_DN40461_c0_g1_i1.p1 TRINITY_DN40461_c0_g1~~TRINITY_DN40461_c0_g1_i1.p1  ORF type:complete len:393 (+),score=64.10 TRINITY_DN40461_c0_g1_i1:31-1179(+)